MYYYKKQNRAPLETGGGFLDSFINAITSQAVKKVVSDASKQVATKAMTEVGSRGTQKIVDKILPRTSGGLTPSVTKKSKDILGKYAIPIEEYVKK